MERNGFGPLGVKDLDLEDDVEDLKDDNLSGRIYQPG